MRKSGFFLFTLLLILCGCHLPKAGKMIPTEDVVLERPTEVAETQIIEEEPTPLPALPKVVYAAESGNKLDPILRNAIPAVCEGRYDYQEITEGNIPADAKYVIFPNVPGDLSSLLNSHPGLVPIVISENDTPPGNAWAIRYMPEALPFLAGLATEENASDWRGIGMLPSDSPLYGENMSEVFNNGGRYLCGNCRALMSPYTEYPFTVSLPSGSSAESWNAGFADAQTKYVYTVFLSDEAAQPEVFQTLLENNIKMLGFSEPPEGLETNWLATINYDWVGTIEEIITRSEQGESAEMVPLKLLVIPGALKEEFSFGKTETLQGAYEKLLDGRLSPFTPTKTYE